MRDKEEQATVPEGAEDMELWAIIDGELYEMEHSHGETYDGTSKEESGEFIPFEDSEAAGVAARQYWEDLAKDDPEEFSCMVGTETLAAWALGQYAGPGSTQVSSLEEWLDLWLDTPEEHFASYDSEERQVSACSESLSEELGFDPGVAYRTN